MVTAGYILSGLVAFGIILIGARFILSPGVAASGYGVPSVARSDGGAYFAVKGIRDIASGLFIALVMIAGSPMLLGWFVLVATIIPIADAAIVLRAGGTRATAFGIHGATAIGMMVTSALLLFGSARA